MKSLHTAMPRLRLVPGSTLQRPATARHLVPDWHRLLTDLSSFGLLDLTADNGWADLRCTAEPWYTTGQEPVLRLFGPGVTLTALTSRWASATLSGGDAGEPLNCLTVRDHADRPLLMVHLDAERSSRGFHARLVHQWARRGTPIPVPSPSQTNTECRALSQEGSDWPAHAMADRSRPPSPLPGNPMDPGLLLPFLETMVDQACPLSVTLANAGLLQRHEASFHDLRHRRDQLQLHNRTARLSLDVNAIAHARLTRQAGAAHIRLYSDRCHCGLGLALARTAHAGQRELWHTMLRALAD